jgi:hypothetical protein
MTTATPHLNVEVLHRYLRDTRRHGARAVQLVWYVPHLVDMLFPPAQYPDLGRDERAVETQKLIQRGIDIIGGHKGHALTIVLGLAPATSETTLTERRTKAASYLGIQLVTWMKRKHEARLMHGLAIEVFQIHQDPTTPESDAA